MLLHCALLVQLPPLPGQPRWTTHAQPGCVHCALLVHAPFVPAPPAEQKPRPSTVSEHMQLALFWQEKFAPVEGIHCRAQWQFPLSTGTPPFLWHLRRNLRVRAWACLGNKGISAAPKAAPPTNLSARLLVIVPSSSPFARSSKKCSSILPLPLMSVTQATRSILPLSKRSLRALVCLLLLQRRHSCLFLNLQFRNTGSGLK